MSESFFEVKDGNLNLNVKVLPGASKTELAGVHDGRLRIKVAAAPEEGKANDCLAAFIAKLLDCRKKEIVIKSGEKSRRKTLVLPVQYVEKAAGLAGCRASHIKPDRCSSRLKEAAAGSTVGAVQKVNFGQHGF